MGVLEESAFSYGRGTPVVYEDCQTNRLLRDATPCKVTLVILNGVVCVKSPRSSYTGLYPQPAAEGEDSRDCAWVGLWVQEPRDQDE